MLFDNDGFRFVACSVVLGGLLWAWGGTDKVAAVKTVKTEVTQPLVEKIPPAQKRTVAKAAGLLDAAIREGMKKRVVNLLTVGPSSSRLETATVIALGDLFSQANIRSVSDLPHANDLVDKWRRDLDNPPKELVAVLGLGDLTILQWLEPSGSGGLALNTWYLAKEKILKRDLLPWGDGGLPEQAVERIRSAVIQGQVASDG